MYRRLSAVMFPIVTLLLIGTVIWGYQVNQEKNSILIKAENQSPSLLRPRNNRSQKMKRPSALLVTEVNFLPVKSRAGQGTVFHEMTMHG